MRNTYNRRKEDFKRRIIHRVYTCRTDLLIEEDKWLSKIKKEELGKKYYNLRNKINGAELWREVPKNKMTISEKLKEKWKDPEYRDKQAKFFGCRKGKKTLRRTLEKE